jgi:hypothetical protein
MQFLRVIKKFHFWIKLCNFQVTAVQSTKILVQKDNKSLFLDLKNDKKTKFWFKKDKRIFWPQKYTKHVIFNLK